MSSEVMLLSSEVMFPMSSEVIIPYTKHMLKGIDLLRNRKYNKGTAFTRAERKYLKLDGLLPDGVFTQEGQAERVISRVRAQKDDLGRYQILMALLFRNQKLFYYVVQKHVREIMPIIYTPTVGLACQHFGGMFTESRGMYISIRDVGHVKDVLSNWESDTVKAIVLTDGERILGLGDLGASGMGIPLGKLALYTALSGINPEHTLPILIDVGTDNKDLLVSNSYRGVRCERIRGRRYDMLIEEFIQAAMALFGDTVLLQFEDFGKVNALRLLRMYQDRCCCFNDDIQGTAAVVTAGVLTALPETHLTWDQHTFLFVGAGSAGLGIAHLIAIAHAKATGCTLDEARARIWCIDSKGLIFKARPSGGLDADKERFAHEWSQAATLGSTVQPLEVYIKQLGITAVFGVSAQGGIFTEPVIRSMTNNCPRPIIFALSNPTSKAECTAEEAYMYSEGKAWFASGSPFDDVTLSDGQHFVPGQGNNSYIFPSVALAVGVVRARHIPDTVFLTAAEALASLVKPEDKKRGLLYPPLDHICDVSAYIAAAVAEKLYEEGVATILPKPKDLLFTCKSAMWSCRYGHFCPQDYEASVDKI